MLKFYVLFCEKSLQRPMIYRRLEPIFKRIQEHKTFTYKVFTSEIEAQKFMAPMKIKYLESQQQYQKEGVYLQNFYKRPKSKGKDKMMQISEDEKKKVKQLLQVMHYQVSKFRQGKNVDGQKNDQISPITWVLTAFQNQNGSNQWIKQEKNSSEFYVKLSNLTQISSKVFQSELFQKLSEEQKKENKNKQKSSRKRNQSKSVMLEDLQFDNEPELNLQIKQIFQTLLKITGSQNNYLEVILPSFPATSSELCVLSFSAFKHPKLNKCGISYVLRGHSGNMILSDQFKCEDLTESQSWYMALILALLQIKSNKFKNIRILCDNENLVSSMQKNGKMKDNKLFNHHFLCKFLCQKIENVSFEWVSPQNNHEARDRAQVALKLKIK